MATAGATLRRAMDEVSALLLALFLLFEFELVLVCLTRSSYFLLYFIYDRMKKAFANHEGFSSGLSASTIAADNA